MASGSYVFIGDLLRAGCGNAVERAGRGTLVPSAYNRVNRSFGECCSGQTFWSLALWKNPSQRIPGVRMIHVGYSNSRWRAGSSIRRLKNAALVPFITNREPVIEKNDA